MANTDPLSHLSDIDAERAVIGSILVDPDAVMNIADRLRPEDFYIERNGYVYAAAMNLWRQDRPIDHLTLCDQLKLDGHLEGVGGAPFLTETILATPSSIHVEQYADTVSRLATLRGLVRVAGEIAKLAYSDNGDLSVVMEKTRALVDNVTPMSSTDEVLLWLDSLEKFVLGQVQRNTAQVEIEQGIRQPPLELPWKAFKQFSVKLRPGTLALVIAGSGIGKTSFMECCAEAWAQHEYQVAFFHLELNHQFMLDRRMCRLSGVSMDLIEKGYLNGNTDAVTRALREYKGGITYVHCPGWSARGITAKMRQLRAKGLCDVGIIDYLQKERLWYRKGATTNDALADAVEVHKTGAEQMGIPIVLGSQVNRRAVDADRVTSDHLRGTGEAPEKANLNITLNRPLLDYLKELSDGTVIPTGSRSPETDVRVDKNTGGGTGDCKLWFIGKQYAFTDVRYNEDK